MRRSIPLSLAVVLFGNVTLAQAQPGDPPTDRPQNNLTQQPQLPDGFQMKELNQIDNIRERVADTVNYAMTQGDFGKVVDQLAVYNRDRTKDWRNEDFKTLDGVIAQLNKDWNARYGHDFKIKRDVLDDRYMIVQGVVTNPNVAAMNFPVPALGNEAQQAASRERANQNDQNANDRGQADQVEAKDLQKSKNVATIRFPSETTPPSVTASMIEEGMIGHWRFALPASTTAQQLHMRLQNELSEFGRDTSKWPAAEADAQRIVAQRVILALYEAGTPNADNSKS
jgi:hypothetical protein